MKILVLKNRQEKVIARYYYWIELSLHEWKLELNRLGHTLAITRTENKEGE